MLYKFLPSFHEDKFKNWDVNNFKVKTAFNKDLETETINFDKYMYFIFIILNSTFTVNFNYFYWVISRSKETLLKLDFDLTGINALAKFLESFWWFKEKEVDNKGVCVGKITLLKLHYFRYFHVNSIDTLQTAKN